MNLESHGAGLINEDQSPHGSSKVNLDLPEKATEGCVGKHRLRGDGKMLAVSNTQDDSGGYFSISSERTPRNAEQTPKERCTDEVGYEGMSEHPDAAASGSEKTSGSAYSYVLIANRTPRQQLISGPFLFLVEITAI